MKSVSSASAMLAVFAAFFASCTPYPEVPPTPGSDVAVNNPTGTNAEGTPVKKPGDEPPPVDDSPASNDRETITEKVEEPDPPKPPSNKPSTKVARPVPGKPGMVFSPFNNKIIDVKGIPSGTLVADPTYPAADKKYFRVP